MVVCFDSVVVLCRIASVGDLFGLGFDWFGCVLFDVVVLCFACLVVWCLGCVLVFPEWLWLIMLLDLFFMLFDLMRLLF